MAVQKTPENGDLGLHAGIESIARGKDDVFTAHHSGLYKHVQCSVLGSGFVTRLQWDRVPAQWPPVRLQMLCLWVVVTSSSQVFRGPPPAGA